MSESNTSKRIKSIKIIAVIVGITLILSGAFYILFKQFFGQGENGGQAFLELVDKSPVLAAIVLFLASVFQVVIAFIPGELLEQVAGVMFGQWLGAAISLVGNVTGSVLVLLLVKRFGRSLVFSIYPKEKFDEISFLKNKKDRNILTFVLFFIPGTPKDLLTYMVGLTDMKISVYLLLTTIARIPSILMSTVSGEWIADMFEGGSFWKIIMWNVGAIVICLGGYIVYLAISRHHKKKREAAESNRSPDENDTSESDT